jgi:hypothetical protein
MSRKDRIMKKVSEMTRAQQRRWGIRQQNNSSSKTKLAEVIAAQIKKELADSQNN